MVKPGQGLGSGGCETPPYSHLAVTRTVDNYVATLRMHIEPRPHHPRYIVTVHRGGYQLLA